VDRIIRICSFAVAVTLLLPANAFGKSEDVPPESVLFWQAQRSEFGGKPAEALKSYAQLVGKLPTSAVAADRLLKAAILHGDYASALKAARAQQLANSGDSTLPLLFYVDAWKRKDWAGAEQAAAWLEDRNIFNFMTPILTAWADVAQGKQGTISNAALRESGLLTFYTYDQLIYLYLANGNVDAAQRKLGSFPGFGDDYARHMAINAAEHLGRNGEADYANSLLAHIGLDPVKFAEKPARFSSEIALSALFSRLSDQLQEQGVPDQALTFARLANWVAPQDRYAAITLAKRLSEQRQPLQARALLDSITPARPQWSWALTYKTRILRDDGRAKDALALVRSAREQKPNSAELMLLEAQQLEADRDREAAAKLYRTLIANNGKELPQGRLVAYRLLLAQSLYETPNWQEARASLEEALKLDSENPQILNMLGYGLLERREDVKRGFELVSKAHRLAPQSAAITDSLGWGHYLNGDFSKAVPLLEQAVEGAISDVTINEHLGDAYWKVGRAIEARYAWRASALQAEGATAERIQAKLDLGWSEATAAP
jgi:Flp pilus assembly protein TadD